MGTGGRQPAAAGNVRLHGTAALAAAFPPGLLHQGSGALALALMIVLLLLWWRELRGGSEPAADPVMDLDIEAVAILDPGGRILRANGRFLELLEASEDEVVGRSLVNFVASWSRTELLSGLREAAGGARVACDVGLAGSGGVTEAEATCGPVRRRRSDPGVWVALRDVTERRQAERALEDRALHDYLTGLPNRILFRDRLVHALRRSRRTGEGLALLFLDLDGFKPVNDRAGHAAGDEALREVARRLTRIARSEDTVARMGGDEYALLLETVRDADEAMDAASRVMASVQLPIDAEDLEIGLSASVGVALSADGAGDADELLRRAEVAMREGKRRGGGHRHLYSPEVESEPHRHARRIEEGLRSAIDRGELHVEYQPIVDAMAERITGIEALVRWEHPELGPVFPSVFIPIAERSDLIVALDRWVLARSCEEVHLMKTRGLIEERTCLSVNLSARHFEEPDLVDAVAGILKRSGLDPRNVQLEITEAAAGEDRAKVRDLKAIGVRVAIDDFGTGYSSLAYVKDLDVDALKVDRAFVQSLGADPASTAIVRTILTLADLLDVDVIIEGVEDPDQLVRIRTLGGRFVQGFMFGRPVRAAGLPAVFARGAVQTPGGTRTGAPGALRPEANVA